MDERPATHTRVLLLRHAETSVPHLFHGAESDIGLSERGIRDSEAIAPTLALCSPVAVFSSPLRRAVETATPIARACGLPLTIEPALHERRIGFLAGQPYDAVPSPWAETLRRWRAGDLAYASPGAESFLDVRDRVLPALNHLAFTFVGQTVVVVTHGALIKIAIMSFKANTFLHFEAAEDFSYPNLGISVVHHSDGQWSMVEERF